VDPFHVAPQGSEAEQASEGTKPRKDVRKENV